MSESRLTPQQRNMISELYRENRDRLVGWMVARGMDVNDALDLYQKSVLAVTERLVKKGAGYFRNGLPAYLFSVMKYMFFFEMKNKNKYASVSLDDEHVKEVQDEMIDFLQEPDEEVLLLKSNLNDLDKKSYELLRLFYYEGKSMKEIAQKLGYSTEQVAKSTKYRILVKLRKKMNNSLKS